jgi:cyclophilin family peptidyl-prolyl cis-trans isomerase
MVARLLVFGFVTVALAGAWYMMSGTGETQANSEVQNFAYDAFGTEGMAQTAAAATPNSNASPITSNQKIMRATLETNMGNITIEFLDKDAPETVANFTKLAKEGFYDGTKFHRVIKGFMIQGGDPLTKDDTMMSRWGTGGPGYQFADEIHANNENVIGTISMANSGPDTNGSQFFINTADNHFLDPKHTVFGRVVEGIEVVAKIQESPTGSADRPVQPVIIQKVVLQ